MQLSRQGGQLRCRLISLPDSVQPIERSAPTHPLLLADAGVGERA